MQGKTQDFLEIDQVKEGVVILKNKSLRGILMVSSVSFSLKSEEEQNAIVFQFQNFLNSLDFFCQIVVQSRKISVRSYLDKIREIETKQPNPLLKMQTADYREFIKQLVTDNTILTKNFFVIVPYFPTEMENIKGGSRFFKKKELPEMTEEIFQRNKQQLLQRMEFVVLGLMRCGLKSIPLTTMEIVELLWSVYHPKEVEEGHYPEFPSDLIS
jgi:type IV secretory pathway VirB4 component